MTLATELVYTGTHEYTGDDSGAFEEVLAYALFSTNEERNAPLVDSETYGLKGDGPFSVAASATLRNNPSLEAKTSAAFAQFASERGMSQTWEDGTPLPEEPESDGQ